MLLGFVSQIGSLLGSILLADRLHGDFRLLLSLFLVSSSWEQLLGCQNLPGKVIASSISGHWEC